MLKMSIVRGCT